MVTNGISLGDLSLKRVLNDLDLRPGGVFNIVGSFYNNLTCAQLMCTL